MIRFTKKAVSTVTTPAANKVTLFIDDSGNVHLKDENGTDTPVGGRLVQNAQTGTSYTVVLTDEQKLVELSNAGAITLTVPANATTAFAVGTQIHLMQTGAGQVTVTPAGGVTINGTPGLKTRAQWSAITLIKRATNTWVVIGDLAA